MVARIKRIVIVILLSFVVAIATGIAAAAAAGPIVGSATDAKGQETLRGGAATTLVVGIICLAAAIIFGIWLNRLLIKLSRIKENE